MLFEKGEPVVFLHRNGRLEVGLTTGVRGIAVVEIAYLKMQDVMQRLYNLVDSLDVIGIRDLLEFAIEKPIQPNEPKIGDIVIGFNKNIEERIVAGKIMDFSTRKLDCFIADASSEKLLNNNYSYLPNIVATADVVRLQDIIEGLLHFGNS